MAQKDYEFSSKNYKAEKSVASEVVVVAVDEVEKSVAEEIKIADPVNAAEIIEAAKAVEVKEEEVVEEVKTEDSI